MIVRIDSVAYVVEFARFSREGAELQVTGGLLPEDGDDWVEFSDWELSDYFDSSRELYPAAEALLCRLAAQQVHDSLKA